MKTITLSAALVCALFVGCASSGTADTADPGRWQAYSGCGESQCRSWNSACEAECMNKSSRKQLVDSDVCMTQCRQKMNECTQSCSAAPGSN